MVGFLCCGIAGIDLYHRVGRIFVEFFGHFDHGGSSVKNVELFFIDDCARQKVKLKANTKKTVK